MGKVEKRVGFLEGSSCGKGGVEGRVFRRDCRRVKLWERWRVGFLEGIVEGSSCGKGGG